MRTREVYDTRRLLCDGGNGCAHSPTYPPTHPFFPANLPCFRVLSDVARGPSVLTPPSHCMYLLLLLLLVDDRWRVGLDLGSDLGLRRRQDWRTRWRLAFFFFCLFLSLGQHRECFAPVRSRWGRRENMSVGKQAVCHGWVDRKVYLRPAL